MKQTLKNVAFAMQKLWLLAYAINYWLDRIVKNERKKNIYV